MIGKLRIMGVAMAATAALGGAVSASAAGGTLTVRTQACVATTSEIGTSTVDVHMYCAATGDTNSAPTSTTAGELEIDVQWSGGLGCPTNVNPTVAVLYTDAYGTAYTANPNPNATVYVGTAIDPTTLAPECYVTASNRGSWIASGSNTYSGMNTLNNLTAVIPAPTLPVSEGEGTGLMVYLAVQR